MKDQYILLLLFCVFCIVGYFIKDERMRTIAGLAALAFAVLALIFSVLELISI